MTEQPTSPTTAEVRTLTEQPPEQPTEQPAEQPTENQEQPPRGRLGREAARYRTQAKEARERAAQLQQQLDERQHRAVLKVLSETLAVPEDLFRLGGVTLADLRDEDGHIDRDRVTEAASVLLERKPGLAKLGYDRGGARTGSIAQGLAGAVASAMRKRGQA